MHRGRLFFSLNTTDTRCKNMAFPSPFSLDKTMHILSSVNYHNTSGAYPHEAVVTWTEMVSNDTFKACALKAGRNDRFLPDGGLTFIDYIAFQGNPHGTVVGQELLSDWWDGTTCKLVSLPQGKFSSAPFVLVASEHKVEKQKHDAATVWVEDVTSSSFRVCVREMQNFDGLHRDLRVNWFAYSSLPAELRTEQHFLIFENDNPLPFQMQSSNSRCQTFSFSGVYSSVPYVIVSASHVNGPGAVPPDYNSIASWVETIRTADCKLCMQELHGPHGYDPVTMSVLVAGQ